MVFLLPLLALHFLGCAAAQLRTFLPLEATVYGPSGVGWTNPFSGFGQQQLSPPPPPPLPPQLQSPMPPPGYYELPLGSQVESPVFMNSLFPLTELFQILPDLWHLLKQVVMLNLGLLWLVRDNRPARVVGIAMAANQLLDDAGITVAKVRANIFTILNRLTTLPVLGTLYHIFQYPLGFVGWVLTIPCGILRFVRHQLTDLLLGPPRI